VAARIQHTQKGRRRLLSSTSYGGGGSTVLHHYNRGMSTSSSAVRPRRAELCRPAAAADSACGIDCGTAPAEHPHRRPRRYALHTRRAHTHTHTPTHKQTHTHSRARTHIYSHTVARTRKSERERKRGTRLHRTPTYCAARSRHTVRTPNAGPLGLIFFNQTTNL